MKLRNASIEEFVKIIKSQQKKIIVFGAGVIAQTVLGTICLETKLGNWIECVIDNDPNKWGNTIMLGKEKVIYSIEKLVEYRGNPNYLIVIASSHFQEILIQLENVQLGDVHCYILPIMYTSNLYTENKGVEEECKEILIPQKIHYMWFGSRDLPKELQKCIDSWKRYCPEYEIVRWDENNYDITKHIYMKQAYEKKQWGFIPDYARLDLLYEYGGIYLDTDVELVKGLDEMLHQSAFASVEKWNVINMGGGSGAVPKHQAIEMMLKEREEVQFINKDGTLNKMASGYYDTIPFINKGFLLNGKTQNICGMNIYGYDYFHPYDYMSGKLQITENTFGIHHFNGGWLSSKNKKERELMQLRYDEVVRRTSVD